MSLFMVYFGWRGMFVRSGVLGLVLASCWFVFYKSKAEYVASSGRAEPVSARAARPSMSEQLADWAMLFRRGTTWGAFLGFMGVIYMLWLHLTWLPGYFEKQHGMDLYKTAWVVSLAYLFGAIGTVVAGRACDLLVRRGMSILGSRKFTIIAGLLTAAGFTLM